MCGQRDVLNALNLVIRHLDGRMGANALHASETRKDATGTSFLLRGGRNTGPKSDFFDAHSHFFAFVRMESRSILPDPKPTLNERQMVGIGVPDVRLGTSRVYSTAKP